MPELPEVEVTRASLADRLVGARVLAARQGKPLRRPLGCAADSLRGLVAGRVQRRGKYLWLPLAEAAPGGALARAGGLLLHLGMSGSLQLADTPGDAGPHDHFDLVTTRGTMRLTDPRRFGAVVWSDALDSEPAAGMLARLGPEPFDPALTPDRFHVALRRHRSAIKLVLLSGQAVVGAGNIYACEALHRAGIDPRMRSDRLSRPRAERLLAELRQTLAQAIAAGGSTLRDFRDAHGAAGAFQDQTGVYGRAGQPCPRCGVLVKRVLQAQRATYWCPGCQRR